ncbi:hypothetical protein HPB48_023195 [Haemaphysalis longicornis]|uniref:THAP-type domain-containing protein n=1 Tax=Haemaphysalis longicornis TaxID=44386 RepID=A0A9J6H4B8_HAELO|nr:hypothetical protein HPB48_023195 [Haemaphysalis longicornis]
MKWAEKVWTHDCVVCRRHFDERFIEKMYRHVINSEDVETPGDRSQLREDAVPSVPRQDKTVCSRIAKTRQLNQ